MGCQTGLEGLREAGELEQSLIGIDEAKCVAVDCNAIGGDLNGVDVKHASERLTRNFDAT